jgi:tetratricopeptide (TPR) repeat protein
MRATLADPALTSEAGRFVWLELDFDKPVNQPFIARHGVGYTPTLLIFDPADERTLASHMGGVSLAGLKRMLDDGESAYRRAVSPPADSLLALADGLLSSGHSSEAADAYREARARGGTGWPQRERSLGSLCWAQWTGGESQACAETAAAEAPGLSRGATFGEVVLAGLACSSRGRAEEWGRATGAILEPLAEEAVGIPAVLRDHRFQLYQQLMGAAEVRADSARVKLWGQRWLDEIEAIQPWDDDERSALDIARVDAASEIGEPERVLPALMTSERAMPQNYSASLRVAQMSFAAQRYDDALAACARGLEHVSGPVGRSWLLVTRANALDGKGDRVGARQALVDALAVAREIGNERNRENNVKRIERALADYDQAAK